VLTSLLRVVICIALLSAAAFSSGHLVAWGEGSVSQHVEHLPVAAAQTEKAERLKQQAPLRLGAPPAFVPTAFVPVRRLCARVPLGARRAPPRSRSCMRVSRRKIPRRGDDPDDL
jgi:hypothetical protein